MLLGFLKESIGQGEAELLAKDAVAFCARLLLHKSNNFCSSLQILDRTSSFSPFFFLHLSYWRFLCWCFINLEDCMINCTSSVSKPLTCWETCSSFFFILVPGVILKFPIPMHSAIPLPTSGTAFRSGTLISLATKGIFSDKSFVCIFKCVKICVKILQTLKNGFWLAVPPSPTSIGN